MNSLFLAAIMFAAYIIAYHTYGKFVAKRIFRINPTAICPSEALRDDVDFIPTNKYMLFGHHFASIAGLGPIIGPAIAIIWGWIPAVLWVLIGSIFMGGIHDFGSLVLSLRNQGRSIGDLSKEIIGNRVRILFLLIIFFELLLVIAVFSLIIAMLFKLYPESVLPVWLQIPIAVYLGYLIYVKRKSIFWLGIAAVITMYITIVIGAYIPVQMPALFGLDPLVIWIIILLIYVYIASTLPVQTLLQPRDYINSHQLIVAMLLLIAGIVIARPVLVAPALNLVPEGAPPLIPFIFVIIACGAISGFHSLVSSGTSSKQCDKESSSLFIGYGGMLTEAALATLVIIAVAAGLGLGMTTGNGTILTGVNAFNQHYASWQAASGLEAKLSAFVTGSVNIVHSIGIPKNIAVALFGVFLVSFAATTLDSATRIQRYVVGELARASHVKFFSGKHPATFIAVILAFLLAFYNGSGRGALTLWPLFGTVNQLMAGLALLVVSIYLIKQKINAIFTTLPMVFVIIMTGWAMVINVQGFYLASNWLLFSIGLAIFGLEIWMIIESLLVIRTAMSHSLTRIFHKQ